MTASWHERFLDFSIEFYKLEVYTLIYNYLRLAPFNGNHKDDTQKLYVNKRYICLYFGTVYL